MAGRLPELDSAQADRGLQVNEQGTEAFAHAGRTINALYREGGDALGHSITQVGGQVGDYIEKHEAQTDIMTNGPKVMQGYLDMRSANDAILNQPGVDPNDPKVKQQLYDNNVKWQTQANGLYQTDAGRAHGVSQIQGLGDHELQRTSDQLQHLTGIHAVQSVQDTTNQAAELASRDHSPEGLKAAVDYITGHSQAVASSGNLSPEAAAHVNTTLTDSSVHAIAQIHLYEAARSDPDQAQKMLDGRVYATSMTTGEKIHAQEVIDKFSRVKLEANKAAEAQQTKQENEAFDSSILQAKMSAFDADGNMTDPSGAMKRVLALGDPRNPAASRKQAELSTAYNWIQGQTNKPVLDVTSDQDTYTGLHEAIFNAKTPQQVHDLKLQIDQLNTPSKPGTNDGKMISDADAKDMRRNLGDVVDKTARGAQLHAVNNLIKSYEPAIANDPMSGARTPEGAQRYGGFQKYALDKNQEAEDLGIAPKDRAEYIFKDIPAKFFTSSDQAVTDLINRTTHGNSQVFTPGLINDLRRQAEPGNVENAKQTQLQPGGAASPGAVSVPIPARSKAGAVQIKPGESVTDFANRLKTGG